MTATRKNVSFHSNKTTGGIAHRMGVFGIASAAILLSSVAPSALFGDAHGRSESSSSYTNIDTSDHPTNPASCRARYSAC
ncbi:MAG: hypothetical protein QOF21_1604 [Actinomycetota bacterium]|jgi:hypothetical protein